MPDATKTPTSPSPPARPAAPAAPLWQPATDWAPTADLGSIFKSGGFRLEGQTAFLAFTGAAQPDAQALGRSLQDEVRAETALRAASDPAIKRYFELASLCRHLEEQRAEANRCLAEISKRKRALIEAKSPYEELSANLAVLAADERPVQDALAALDGRHAEALRELAQANREAALVLANHATEAIKKTQARLKGARQKLMGAIAARCDAELSQLAQLDTAARYALTSFRAAVTSATDGLLEGEEVHQAP